MILKMAMPDLGLMFEWHPEARALYCVTPNFREQIAADINDPQTAQFATMMWSKGYRSRAREITRKPGAKHYHMLAETGKFGVTGTGL